jgi:hypothetical protein
MTLFEQKHYLEKKILLGGHALIGFPKPRTDFMSELIGSQMAIFNTETNISVIEDPRDNCHQ